MTHQESGLGVLHVKSMNMTFMVCSPSVRISSHFPQFVTAFVLALKGRPMMIGA